MKTQTITTPGGEELVVLARGDFDALVAAARAAEEDADDVAIYDARMAEIASGADAPLPVDVSAFLLRGDSLLKAVRKARGVTQQELAERTGLAQGYLSDLENGRRTGAAETLVRIAEALGAPPEWLQARDDSSPV